MVAYDPDIDRAVLLYNQISGNLCSHFFHRSFPDRIEIRKVTEWNPVSPSGPLFFLTALGVFLLMYFDNDTRNVVYRRIIICLQVAFIYPKTYKVSATVHAHRCQLTVSNAETYLPAFRLNKLHCPNYSSSLSVRIRSFP